MDTCCIMAAMLELALPPIAIVMYDTSISGGMPASALAASATSVGVPPAAAAPGVVGGGAGERQEAAHGERPPNGITQF